MALLDESVPIPTFTPKFTLMADISFAFVVLWLIAGFILSIYIYIQTEKDD